MIVKYISFAEENFQSITALLESDGVFIIPSDTSFGFSASPFSRIAIKKIQTIKGREEGKPFLLLVSDFEEAQKWAYFPLSMRSFVVKRWSNRIPTTVIAKKKAALGDFFPEFDSVGIRVPGHPFLQKFLKYWGKPLISTSANRSGEDPLFFERDIYEEFGKENIYFSSYGNLLPRSQSEIWKVENKILVRVR